jgi:hydrogenase maturation protease
MTQILIAGIGNAWMRDDGFGSAVAERLGTRDLPREAAVMDFGTGGLDLDAAVDVVVGTLDELVAQRG